MGLLQSGVGAATSVLADAWREYFYAEAFPSGILAVRGHKRTDSKSSNKGSDNIISNGSIISVNDG